MRQIDFKQLNELNADALIDLIAKVNSGITLEDGTKATIGDRVYNYYDCYPVTITAIDREGWADTVKDNGERGPWLNGERLCSVATALAKGWA
jgi:hypothetical protein